MLRNWTLLSSVFPLRLACNNVDILTSTFSGNRWLYLLLKRIPILPGAQPSDSRVDWSVKLGLGSPQLFSKHFKFTTFSLAFSAAAICSAAVSCLLLGFFQFPWCCGCVGISTTHDYDGEMVTETLDVDYSNSMSLISIGLPTLWDYLYIMI